MLQKINLNSPVFVNLSVQDKSKYKLFLSTLIKLGRSTKQLLSKNPEINKTELPTFSIVDIDGNSHTIEYSIKFDKWLISENNTNQVLFNPSVMTGIIEFLNNFDLDHIESGVQLYQETIDDLSLKYGINY